VDSFDFSASTGTTLASRNNNAATAAANTLDHPDPSSSVRHLSRYFPLRLTLGADASAGRGNNIVLSRRGGTADPGSPHIYRLEDIGFSLSSLLEQATAQFGLSFPDQDGNSLVNGSWYRLVLNSDTGSASAPQVVIASAAYDASVHSASAAGPAGYTLINDDTRSSALRLEVSNNSPAGFNGVEIATVSFRLYDADLAAPLTAAGAAALFDAIALVADSTHTGLSGTYEPAVDLATAAWVPMASITLDGDGRSTLTVPTAGLGASFVAAGSTRPFYIVFVTTRNASSKSPDTFRVRFDPSSGVSVRDASGLLGQDFVPGAHVDTASFTVIAPALPPPDTDWPYVSESSAPITGGVMSWVGAPLDEGRLYLPSSDGTVVALSTTGALRWAFTTSPLTSVGATPSFPAKEGAELYLYFTGANGDVYKIEDEGGSVRQAWKVPLGAEAVSILDTDARVYVPTVDKRIHCLNKSDGSACSPWAFSSALTGVPSGTPSVDERATVATAWIGLEDGKVVSIKTGDGTSDTAFQAGGPIRSSPYLDAYAASPDNALYITSTDGRIYALNSGNMTKVDTWEHYDTFSSIHTSPFVWPLGGTKYVFFGADNGRLYKLNAATGDLVWSFQAGGAIRSSPVVVPSNFEGLGLAEGEDYVYFGCDDGKIYAVNGNTGAIRTGWPVSTGGPVRADPVYDPDSKTISVGSNDGRLYTLYVGP
jgi:outer membrane protein assembly factor BamB